MFYNMGPCGLDGSYKKLILLQRRWCTGVWRLGCCMRGGDVVCTRIQSRRRGLWFARWGSWWPAQGSFPGWGGLRHHAKSDGSPKKPRKLFLRGIWQLEVPALQWSALSLALPAKYADRVDLKDGLLNNRVCTVKILAKESYFSRNTTHTKVPPTRMD